MMGMYVLLARSPDVAPVIANDELFEEVVRNYEKVGHPTYMAGQSKMMQFYKGRAKKSDILDIMKSIHAYNMHRQYKRPSPRTPYLSLVIRSNCQVDLIHMERWREVFLPNHNSNVRYLALFIDIFSRRVWLRPLLAKTASATLLAIGSVLRQMENSPPFLRIQTLQSDEVKW